MTENIYRIVTTQTDLQFYCIIHMDIHSDPVNCSPTKVPPSMDFSRQGCWSGLSFPSPGDLPNPGIEPRSPVLQADSFTV